MTNQEQTKKQEFPYKLGDEGYNRQSGKKTLVFVGICIILIVFLFLFSIYLISQSSRIMIK